MFTKNLPDFITVNGDDYLLKTDFKIWYGYISGEKEIADLFLYNAPEITEELIAEIKKFLSPPKKYPRTSYKSTNPTIDFEGDSAFIYADFWNKYQINLNTAELHWHEFKALFDGLFATMADITSIRSYDGKDKERQKQKVLWQIQNSRPQDDVCKELERKLRGEK